MSPRKRRRASHACRVMHGNCAHGSRRIRRIAVVRPAGGAKSNRTDNESAKMATDAGVIQGYTGVAAVDAKHQIIVEAQAHGTGSEQELLLPVVAAPATMRHRATVLTADAGYQTEANLRHRHNRRESAP